MPAQPSFEYAVVRIVPRVDREEFINAGVVLFCEARDFLAARVVLDEARLFALTPDADVEVVRRHLDAVPRVCGGGPGAGPIGQLPLRERWRWIVAPRSTILQMSAAHAGRCGEPDVELERLFEKLVKTAPAR